MNTVTDNNFFPYLTYPASCTRHRVSFRRNGSVRVLGHATLSTAKLRTCTSVESSWNAMAQSYAREERWSGNWRMNWIASTLHTTSEHGVSSITTSDAHTSAASSRLNWYPCRFTWTRPFHRKTKSGFCAFTITFQTQSTSSTLFRLYPILLHDY
jgi:hypothetical protein